MNLILTILIAALLMGLVIAALSIGLLLTGKSRLRRGCGWSLVKKPKKNSEDKNDDLTNSCTLCGNNSRECKNERDTHHNNSFD